MNLLCNSSLCCCGRELRRLGGRLLGFCAFSGRRGEGTNAPGQGFEGFAKGCNNLRLCSCRGNGGRGPRQCRGFNCADSNSNSKSFATSPDSLTAKSRLHSPRRTTSALLSLGFGASVHSAPSATSSLTDAHMQFNIWNLFSCSHDAPCSPQQRRACLSFHNESTASPETWADFGSAGSSL